MADQAISPFNPVTGEPRTIHTESRTLGESVQRNELSPQALKALAAQRRAEAEQLEAMLGSGPAVAQPTAAGLDAELASQEQSELGIAKDPTAATPMATAEAAQAVQNDVRSADEILAGVPNFDTGAGAVTPRFTSQQFNQAVDATRPTTAVAQKDENAADKAETEQRLYQQELAQREAVAKQVAEMQAKLQEEIDKASAEYAKTASLSREQVTPLMAFAAGLGALGAGLTRTPNFANDNINKAMDRSLEEKKMLMEGGIRKMEQLRARPAQIEKFREQALADIMAKQKAEVGLLGAYADRMMARFPQAADALRSKMAEVRAGFDKDYAQYIGTRTARQFNKDADRVTDTSALGGAGSRKTESEQKLNLLGESMKSELAAIRKGAKLTSKDLDQVQKDTLAAEAADKAAEAGQLASGGIGLGRSAGLVSKSRYQNLSPDKQKTLNAWDNAIEKYARVLTGAGMPAEEARRMSRQNGPMAGDTPDVIEFKLQRLEREAERMIGLSKNAAATMAREQVGEKEATSKVRAIPSDKQDAAVAAADDYTAIRDAMKSKKLKLTNQESLDLAEAYAAQKRAAQGGGVDKDAARFFREIRQRKGI